jgi:short-subunit dehydrogenase involved in D-alanine esterification of teichoic acids
MKIGITGHTKGLGLTIYNRLNLTHNVIGFSRTNGYDVQSSNKIIEKLNDCDVFINNVYYQTTQSDLFLKLFEKWKDLEKTIININSSSIHQSGAWNPIYVSNKKHLNNITQSLIDKYPNKKVRVINLNLGTLESHNGFANFNKIENNKVAEIIEWCINQSHNIEIQQLTILPTTQLK